MGSKDTATIRYMRQNPVFADALNYFLFGGAPVIDPRQLEEMDTRELAVPYGGEEGVGQPVQRTRDILKVLTAKSDQHMAYLLLGIENQSHIHYAMPVRSLLYDALQYTKQVEEAAASHRKSGDYKGAGEDEFLSGFMKDDRLLPVVTLVIYFGKECWDGPLSLHEMFAEQIREESAEVMEFVPDYRMNLIAPGLIGDEDFSRFRSTLKEVLAFIKYSGDRERLTELVQADERFRRLGRAEVDVLNACARADIPVQERKEETNVCEAIQEMIDEARQEGREEKEREMCQGLKEMIDEARQEGRDEKEKEKEKEMCRRIHSLMKKAGWSLEQTMEMMDIPEEGRETLRRQMAISM